MKGDATTTQRSPFHYGLFFNAMKGLIGRDPSNKFCYGWDGLYEFHYYPSDFTALTSEDQFHEFAQVLSDWADRFDITFSRSEIRFGEHRGWTEKGRFLLVKITHPVEKA